MKKVFAALLLTASFAIASAQSISFDKTTVEYGTVKNGADGNRVFTVKNTGDKPLIISNVKASCGCTTPDWSKDPIMPGKSSEIKVGYNTTLTGPFAKNIEVFSNDPANSRSVITIKGTVEPAVATTTAASVSTMSVAPAAEKMEVRSSKTDAKAKKMSK